MELQASWMTGLKGLKRKLVQSGRGFTLIEILVAATLLVVVVMPLLKLISDGMIQSQANKEETYAISLAQQKVEEIRQGWPAKPADISSPGQYPAFEMFDSGGLATQAADQAKFYRSWYVSDVTPPTAPNTRYLFKVVVTVKWTDKLVNGDQPHAIAMELYLTGRD